MNEYSDYLEGKVRRIILFGSVVASGEFRPHSDVDVYIEGLEYREYFRVRAFLRICCKEI